MAGGSRKLGRGGGGGGGNRSIHTPPIKRPSSSSARLSMGGGESRGRGGASSSSAEAVEESFSLVRENPLNYAMAIKLTPDLVEEIKRVEAQGSNARIKFNVNPHSADGNVISLGDKSFKFTWSQEVPCLCDIYEERRSGEGGNGLLVESGTTSRKLSVQRELDESIHNHVKRRSEEAERMSKSRKAICLDPQNSSMKTQAKALAAVESTQRRNFNKKDPHSRKPNSETVPAGPHKPIPKPGLSTTTPSKGKTLFGSPSSSQPEKYGASASPFTSGNLIKGHDTVADVPTTHNTSKTPNSDKETRSRLPSSASGNKSRNSRDTDIKPSDLRSLIVSLLMENHSKGMSLKGLEKAIGNTVPCSARQIEPILRQIATLEAPGRYFLKEGVEIESLKKPPIESGSLQTSHHKSPGSQMFDQVFAQDAILSVRTDVNDEEQAQLRSTPGHMSDEFEKVDILHNSPDHFSDKKVFNNSEGLHGSSSDSGSDSDSDSDGSDSSSDSESDASSSSKQASDEDVDIMPSDDDKEFKDKLHNSDPPSMKSPFPLNHPEEFVDIGNYERQDEHVSDIVDIERDSPLDNHEAARSTSNHSFPNQEGGEPAEEIKSYSAEYHENRERHDHDRKSHAGPDSGTHDSIKTGQSADHQRSSKSKSKRHSDEMPNNSKRLKGKNSRELVSGTISLLFGETTNTSSPDEPLQQPSTGTDQIAANFPLDDNNDHSLELGFNEGIPAEPHQPVQRSLKASGRPEALSRGTKSGKHGSSGRGVKNSEINIQSNENGLSVEKHMTRLSAEGQGDKHATFPESHHRKPELHVKPNVADPRHSSGHFTKETNNIASDKSPVMNGRGRVLQREQSDLELGEFREPNNDENSGPRKQFERKSSFKQLDNRPVDSSDSNRKRPSNKINADSRKSSTPNSEAVASGFRDGPSKKKVSDHYADDHTRIQNRHTPPVIQQQQSSGVHTEVASESNKSRYAEAGKDQEARTNTSRKVPNNAADQMHDPIQGVVAPSTKESKRQKTSKVSDSHKRKDAPLTGSIDGGLRRRESSSDENSCSYTKYEKEEPELKGPIRNVSQYREYVKEYQEKYESYWSLNKVLESYREEFSNLGKDLETYRDRDMKKYHEILGQIKASFHQCGERHKRLKKIFVVLYEELKHLKQMIKEYAASYTKDGGS